MNIRNRSKLLVAAGDLFFIFKQIFDIIEINYQLKVLE